MDIHRNSLAVVVTVLVVVAGTMVANVSGQETTAAMTRTTMTKDCSSGVACFPQQGFIPDGVTPTDMHYFCCLDKNMTRHSNRLEDGSINCTCVENYSLEGKVRAWADSSKDQGRMCVQTDPCPDSDSSNTINDRFKFCCPDSWPRPADPNNFTVQTTIFDGDKVEFIGCRCVGSPLPVPTPGTYVVPPTSLHVSTGESCSYGVTCQESPPRACPSPGATFCCFGSRGIVTSTENGNLTRCTCTNEVFGSQCDPRPVPFPGSTTDPAGTAPRSETTLTSTFGLATLAVVTIFSRLN